MIVDLHWSETLNTPKMRGLKQMFISLTLYNCNRWIDGIKVELAHQWPKNQQLRKNNSRQAYKTMVTNACGCNLSLLYVFNDGHWGSEWQYSLGPKARQLKDPDDPTKPHSLIAKWMIPTDEEYPDQLQITQTFAHSNCEDDKIAEILFDEHTPELLQIIQNALELPQLTVDELKSELTCTVDRIQSFRFHASNQSFAINFKKLHNTHDVCLVKLIHGYVMKFVDAFVMQYKNFEPLYLCKGSYWKIYSSDNPNQWHGDLYSSMDYINHTQKRTGWSLMNYITEPVFLIHNCVSFTTVQSQCPTCVKDITKYDFIQNLVYWSNRMQNEVRQTRAKNTAVLPCGPVYVCTKHAQVCCPACTSSNIEYESDSWTIEWWCNMQLHPHMWVLDAKNGLVMTRMKTVSQTV